MNLRERAMAIFKGEIPDRMPWFSDLSYWVTGQRLMGKLPEEYEGNEGYLKLHQDLGVGIFAFAPPVHRTTRDKEIFKTSIRQDGDIRIHKTQTPDGMLRTVHQYSGVTFSNAPLEYPVKTPDDLRALRSYYEGSSVTPNLEGYTKIKALWGDQGIAVLWAPRSPLGQLAVQWAGVANLSYLLADHPEDVEKTLALIAEKQDPIYEIICNSPAQVIEIGDNLTGETMGGLFRRYSAPYYRKRAKQLHDVGKYMGVHLDGTMKGLITDVANTGLDYIEAITPAPVGDVPVEALFSLVTDKTIIWGGVPGAMFAPPYTWDDVQTFVENIVQCHGSSGRFVLCSADQVPVNGDIDYVRKISELVESHPL